MSNDPTELSRRKVLGGMAAASAAMILPKSLIHDGPTDAIPPLEGKSMIGVPFERHAKVRIGFIGCGGRGSSLIGNLLAIDDVEIKALCDVVPQAAQSNAKRIQDAGQPAPALYTKGDHDYENLCARDDIDLVMIATPWDWHVPMAVKAMESGKHAVTEVPAASTIEDCWRLVNTSEKTRRHGIMIENCCYGWSEMMVLNMVRAGLLGDLTHGEAAYLHDLRGILTANNGEGLWRRKPHMERNGNFYPTHGLGPVANYMNVNRGDAFDYMVSMSSLEHSLTQYVQKNFPPTDPKRKEKYIEGDTNISLIKTKLGRTIVLQHDVVSPRVYDRLNHIAGTKGIFKDYPPRIYLDGNPEDWETLDKYKAQYEHDLWKRIGELARKAGGHGGMDFIMCWRLIQTMKEGLVPDMDVYDAAAWSVPCPLSQTSVARGSAPQKFPDFTRGRWSEKRSGMP